MASSSWISLQHFLVGKRVPVLASSTQYLVTPLLTSGCSPKLLAFFTVSCEGFAGAASDAVVCAAAGVEVWAGAAAVGVVVAAEAAAGGGVLAGGALEFGCCEYAGSAAANIAPIRSGKRTFELLTVYPLSRHPWIDCHTPAAFAKAIITAIASPESRRLRTLIMAGNAMPSGRRFN